MRRIVFILLVLASLSATTLAADELPLIDTGQDFSVPMKIFIFLTVLSLIPTLVIALTCFTRIIVVLSLLRQGMSLQQVPSGQVMVALALILTFYVMYPTGQSVYASAIKPYMDGELSPTEALDQGYEPIRDFMLRQTDEKELLLFYKLANLPRPKSTTDVPAHVLVPSFMLSELKTAFHMGFMIYLPFLIVDLIVSSLLMSMGMFMIPPIMISLPFKLLIFVLADGWALVAGSLVQSFH